MNIQETKINYEQNVPYEVELCRVRHIDPHYHLRDLELLFCLSGAVELTAGHQNVWIRAGEVFSVDCRDIHYIHSSCDNLLLIFHLDLTKMCIPWENLKHLFFACESCHCYPYQTEAMDKVKDILLALSCAYFLEPGFSSPESAQAAADQLIRILYQHFNWFNYEQQDAYMNLEMHNRFYRILAYCNENFSKKISASQLAESEHISKNYFSQFISRTVFKSFNLMLKYIRCYEAEHLLLTTDLSNAEVAYRCGFSDPKYFYSTFKHWWECTPTEHRNRYQTYLQEPSSFEVLNAPEALRTLKESISRWHMEKIFRE